MSHTKSIEDLAEMAKKELLISSCAECLKFWGWYAEFLSGIDGDGMGHRNARKFFDGAEWVMDNMDPMRSLVSNGCDACAARTRALLGFLAFAMDLARQYTDTAREYGEHN